MPSAYVLMPLDTAPPKLSSSATSTKRTEDVEDNQAWWVLRLLKRGKLETARRIEGYVKTQYSDGHGGLGLLGRDRTHIQRVNACGVRF